MDTEALFSEAASQAAHYRAGRESALHRLPAIRLVTVQRFRCSLVDRGWYRMTMPGLQRRMAAILVADVVGYSRLVEIDEAGTLAAVKRLRREVIDPLLAKHHGRVVKWLGDGVLVEFASVVDAVNFAITAQRETVACQAGQPRERRIVFRVGVNLGDVVVEDDDLLGDGVNVAARLESLCDPGGVLISGTAHDHLRGKLDLPLDYAGDQHVKNIARPIPTFRVRLDGGGRPWWLLLRQYSGRLGWAATLIMVALGAAASWQAFVRPGASLVGSSTLPSVAVLPFNEMSGRSELGYFGDGVAEDIISMLARVPDLTVVARNSSFTYKDQAVDVRKIGQELGVTHVLEGSVRKEADRVRIVAQLVDAKTGEHVWAERFDRSSPDPWALQDEVTGKIVGALVGDGGTLKKAQYRDAWGKDSTSLQEYDYYLRGHDLFFRGREGLAQARELWTEGLVKFPDSELLKIKLGWAVFMRGFNAWSDDATADYRRARQLVAEAMAQPRLLSPMERRLGYWLSAMVSLTERRFERALSEAEAALELSPHDAFMLGDLSQVPIMAGRPAQAIDWIERAASLETVRPQYLDFYEGWALALDGRLEESLAALKRDQRQMNLPRFMQAIVLKRLDRTVEAQAALKQALAIDAKFTQVKWRELFFYSDPAIVEREVADLASLGLPEK